MSDERLLQHLRQETTDEEVNVVVWATRSLAPPLPCPGRGWVDVAAGLSPDRGDEGENIFIKMGQMWEFWEKILSNRRKLLEGNISPFESQLRPRSVQTLFADGGGGGPASPWSYRGQGNIYLSPGKPLSFKPCLHLVLGQKKRFFWQLVFR